MLNEGAAVEDRILQVMEGIELHGRVNVEDDYLLTNVKHAVRRGLPQVRPQQPNYDRVVLVGGGPSLLAPDAVDRIRQHVWNGAKLVTLNGAYNWCIERGLQPRTQFVMDARGHNARFLEPAVPDCRYVLASQCHPDVFDAVAGRQHVFIFHAAAGKDEPVKQFLDRFYRGQWFGVGGGTTVASRAISCLRTLGYMRFHLFGIDSCWMEGSHHAYSQPENSRDKPYKVTIEPTGRPDLARTFLCSPWHMKQVEDFLQLIRVNGEHFLLDVYGDGIIAYLLQAGADAVITEAPPEQEKTDGCTGVEGLQSGQEEDRKRDDEPGGDGVSHVAAHVGLERGHADAGGVRVTDE